MELGTFQPRLYTVFRPPSVAMFGKAFLTCSTGLWADTTGNKLTSWRRLRAFSAWPCLAVA